MTSGSSGGQATSQAVPPSATIATSGTHHRRHESCVKSNTEILLARNAGTTRTTTKRHSRTRQPREAQERAGSAQSSKQRKTKRNEGGSRAEQGTSGTSQLTALLSSPMIRNVLAAGLVSAAAALVYRKPKAIGAASEHVQEAASELLDGAVDVARTTTKTARKVKRKAAAAVEAIASPSGDPKGESSEASVGSSSGSKKGSSNAQAAPGTALAPPQRKRRSDAGVPRRSRTSLPAADALAGSPSEPSVPLTGLHETEASALALGGAPAEPTGAPASADEPAHEAHSS